MSAAPNSMMALLAEPFRDLLQCCNDPSDAGTSTKDEAQRLLKQWRPAASAFGLSLAAKRKDMADDEEEKHKEEEADEDDDEEKSEGQGSVKSGSVRSAKSLSDDDDSDDDAARGQLAEIRAQKQKTLAKMEFEPILELVGDADAVEFDEPADLIQTGGSKKKKKRKAGTETGMGSGEATEWVRKMLGVMHDGRKDVELPSELSEALGVDIPHLVDAVKLAGDGVLELQEDDDGNQVFEKALAQKIWEEIMENDGEPARVDDLVMSLDSNEDDIEEAVEETDGLLILEKKKRFALVKVKEGVQDLLDRAVEDEAADAGAKEAEARAIEFRRIQVQRKTEDFLRSYTRGQNLIKIANGKRYHRRVYIDTGKKALVVQGASGPKTYEFAHMREVDMESRTTKEGRLETLVTIAMESKGRIYKELTLSFPDQHKGNTFVNCLSLFAMALRKAEV